MPQEKQFMYRVDIYNSVLSLDEESESKYLYLVTSMALRYLKQKSYTENHNFIKKKNSTRFITYPEIRYFLKAYGYKTINTKWYNSSIETFKKSKFVQSYNTLGVVLAPKSEILGNHTLYSSLIINPNKEEYNNFMFKKFMELSIKFLYGMPQSTLYNKYGLSGVQPQGQTSIADKMKVTQSRVQQVAKDYNKVYIFSKVSSHEKQQSMYFNNSYVYTIKNTGVNKEGKYREDVHYKLLGTKFLGTLNYKSFVRGCSKNQPGKIQQRRLTSLAHSNNKDSFNKYKLASPKRHSRIDKIGFLDGFETNIMSKIEVNSSSSKTRTYQVVSKRKKEALRKLSTLVRIDLMYSDLESVAKKNKLRFSGGHDINRGYLLDINKRYKNITYYIKAIYKQLKSRGDTSDTKWLYKNIGTLDYYVVPEIQNAVRNDKLHKIKNENKPKYKRKQKEPKGDIEVKVSKGK